MVRSYSNRGRGVRGGQLGRVSGFRPRGRGKLMGAARVTSLSRSRAAFNASRVNRYISRPRGGRGSGGLGRAMAQRRIGHPLQQQQQRQQQRFGRGRGRGLRRGRGGQRSIPMTQAALDAQLEAYMGDDVVKQRLDRDLDAYFNTSEPQPQQTQTDSEATNAMEVTMEASTL